MNTDKMITLELSQIEAVVFFEWLKTLENGGGMDTQPDDVDAPISAERIVLWKLEAQLDKILAAPFAGDYREVVANARRLVVASAVEDEEPGSDSE